MKSHNFSVNEMISHVDNDFILNFLNSENSSIKSDGNTFKNIIGLNEPEPEQTLPTSFQEEMKKQSSKNSYSTKIKLL